jgi:putative choline sulfate-utilization transcription factor
MESLSRSLPPLRALLAFEAAARLGSFTRAADELNVSQPAISRQVRALEEALGVPLFLRDHRRVTLTLAGQSYREAIVHGLNSILLAGRRIAESGASERVTIHANYGLASYWLIPRLAELQAAHPEVEIAVATMEEDRAFSEAEAEVAIRFGKGRWRDGATQLLFPEAVFPVCSPRYLETSPPLKSVADLERHKLLHVRTTLERPWLDWRSLLKALKANSPNSAGSSYNNYTLAIQAALAGQGLAIGWKHIVDDFLDKGWLVKPLDIEVTTAFGYYSVANRMAQNSDNAKMALDWLHR